MKKIQLFESLTSLDLGNIYFSNIPSNAANAKILGGGLGLKTVIRTICRHYFDTGPIYIQQARIRYYIESLNF